MRWWATPLPLQTWIRTFASALLGCLHLIMGMAYLVPGLGVTNAVVGAPDQVYIVSTIDNYGPWWTLGFLSTGVFILVGTLTKRLLQLSHLLGMAVIGAFDFAVWWGTIASHPNRSIVTGVLGLGWFFWHVAMMLVYTVELAKGRREWKP